LLAGDAKPEFPAGSRGRLDVVSVGPLSTSVIGDSMLPVALRNNTGAAVAHIDLSAVARDRTGNLVATGTSLDVDPAQLAPGELGLSSIYFQIGTTPPPKDSTYSFSVETDPADTSSYNTSTVKVTEANRSGSTIVGTGINTTGQSLTGPYGVSVYCFDAANHLMSAAGSYADQDNDLSPGASVSFTADLDGQACPRYLVGITGYYA
jgi:hypothetical protein